VLAAEPGIVEVLVAAWFWSVALAFAFGFTGCEYEGAVDEALLEGCVVVDCAADWSAAEVLGVWLLTAGLWAACPGADSVLAAAD
jgi:hypothetical protein